MDQRLDNLTFPPSTEDCDPDFQKTAADHALPHRIVRDHDLNPDQGKTRECSPTPLLARSIEPVEDRCFGATETATDAKVSRFSSVRNHPLRGRIAKSSKDVVSQPVACDFDALNQAIADCVTVIETGFFAAQHRGLSVTLAPTYALSLALRAGGKIAYNKVRDHEHFADKRKRAPQLGKPALLAVLFTLQPNSKDQNKLCSEYACMIECAYNEGVTVSDFTAWATNRTLAECKATVRLTRLAKKLADGEPKTKPSPEAKRKIVLKTLTPLEHSQRSKTVFLQVAEWGSVQLSLPPEADDSLIMQLKVGGEHAANALREIADLIHAPRV